MDRPRRSTRQPPPKAPVLVAVVPPPPSASGSGAGSGPGEGSFQTVRPVRRKPVSGAGNSIGRQNGKEKANGSGSGRANGSWNVKANGPESKVDKEEAAEKQLKVLLTSSKSDLVGLEMTDIINPHTWAMLSEHSRAYLKTLLPETAFVGYGYDSHSQIHGQDDDGLGLGPAGAEVEVEAATRRLGEDHPLVGVLRRQQKEVQMHEEQNGTNGMKEDVNCPDVGGRKNGNGDVHMDDIDETSSTPKPDKHRMDERMFTPPASPPPSSQPLPSSSQAPPPTQSPSWAPLPVPSSSQALPPASSHFDPTALLAFSEHHPVPNLPELLPSFFTDPHFLSSLRTFQDQLYLNWFTDAHLVRVREYEKRVIDGEAGWVAGGEWKDLVWEREHRATGVVSTGVADGDGATVEKGKGVKGKGAVFGLAALASNLGGVGGKESNARAGGAAELKLSTLVKDGIVRVGDVIAYRRSFATHEVVEKDCIVESIHQTTYALTILASPGTTKDLPANLLSLAFLSSSSSHPHDSSAAASSTSAQTNNDIDNPPVRTTISAPTSLENFILDLDGTMEKGRRPNGNAWKCFGVWRWRDGGSDAFGYGEVGGYEESVPRGGRENHGTLFYLRGSLYHER